MKDNKSDPFFSPVATNTKHVARILIDKVEDLIDKLVLTDGIDVPYLLDIFIGHMEQYLDGEEYERDQCTYSFMKGPYNV